MGARFPTTGRVLSLSPTMGGAWSGCLFYIRTPRGAWIGQCTHRLHFTEDYIFYSAPANDAVCRTIRSIHTADLAENRVSAFLWLDRFRIVLVSSPNPRTTLAGLKYPPQP